MKKWLPYILGGLALVSLLLLLAGSPPSERRQDERITLRARDKVPYGSWAVRRLLPHLFPKADITVDAQPPGEWKGLTSTSYNQAVVLMSREFHADEETLQGLLQFASFGNHVFIITRTLSYDANRLLRAADGNNSFAGADSSAYRLEQPPFPTRRTFKYTGRRYESIFTELDTAHTRVLGRNGDGQPNFIQLSTGQGRLYVHLAPLTFTNAFLLQPGNEQYTSAALSVIPADVDKLVWNEYFLEPPRNNSDQKESSSEEPRFLRVLLQYPSFRWALLTALGMLLIFALLEMRRKQRYQPRHVLPRNDSLDFVKTMGRLYYERRDHGNLARKMAQYFQEHVRLRYKLPAGVLDTAFAQSLQARSGYPPDRLHTLLGFVRQAAEGRVSAESELAQLHRHLESFYQNT